jgi:MFS family permease
MLGRYQILFPSTRIRTASLASFFARFPMAMWSLGLLLLMTSTGYSLAEAGICAGATAIGAGLFAPAIGRFLDAGHYRMKTVSLTLITSAALAGILVFAHTGISWWGILPLCIILGGVEAPIGATMRTIWSYIHPDNPATQRIASMWEGAISEASYIPGPLLLAGIIAIGDPTIALAVAGVIHLIGVGVWAWALPDGLIPHPPDKRRYNTALTSSPLRFITVLAAVFVFLFTYGLVEVSLVSFTTDRGQPALAGVGIGGMSIIALIAGLVFGPRILLSPSRLLLCSLLAFGIGACLIVASLLVGVLWLVVVSTIIAGVSSTILLSAIYERITELAVLARQQEAFGYYSVAGLVGLGLGPALGGAMLQLTDAEWLTVSIGVLLCVCLAGFLAYEDKQTQVEH